MSVQGIITVNGQMSLIDPQPRTMDVYYSMPDEPNEKTGLLVLVPGFGGNCNSKVYQKMRRLFADQYNLYVIQCEYFGSRFMQSELGKVNLLDYSDSIPESIRSKVINGYEEYKYLLDGLTLERVVDLKETESDYAEMGVVQATDILIAIRSFNDFLNDYGKPLNHKICIGYGHSQGAYLLYLCNALMPNCFSDLIDISAWTFPMYIDYRRTFSSDSVSPRIQFVSHYVYLVSQLDIDRESYALSEYYRAFDNKTAVYSFHGDSDSIIKLEEKIKFLSAIPNSSVEVIGESRVDNELFSSNKHGLGADYLKLFDYVVNRYDLFHYANNRDVLKFDDMSFSTSKNTYWLGYDERIKNIQMYIIEK